jgi:hypothetical protein
LTIPKIINFWKKVEELGFGNGIKNIIIGNQKYQPFPCGCEWKLKLRDRKGRAKYCSGYESFPRKFKD